jgi:hypothetical protein
MIILFSLFLCFQEGLGIAATNYRLLLLYSLRLSSSLFNGYNFLVLQTSHCANQTSGVILFDVCDLGQ